MDGDLVCTLHGQYHIDFLGRSTRSAAASVRAVRMPHVEIKVVVPIGVLVEQGEAGVGRTGRHVEGVPGYAHAGCQGSIDIVGGIIDYISGLHVRRRQAMGPCRIGTAVAEGDVKALRAINTHAHDLDGSGERHRFDRNRAAHAVRAVSPGQRAKGPLVRCSRGQGSEGYLVGGRLTRSQGQGRR